MPKELIENFIMHPDWPKMVEFIEKHFERTTEIGGIDTSKPASTIVGEVIASQKIAQDLQSLKDSFSQLRKNYGKEKIKYE